MDKIVRLMDEKNHFLEKFREANERELKQFSIGNFVALAEFYDSREKLLEIIKTIDEKLDEAQAEVDWDALKLDERVLEMRFKIKNILSEKDALVAEILAQDLQILSYIDQEKSHIIKELRQIKKTKAAVGAYRNPTSTKRLDEEF